MGFSKNTSCTKDTEAKLTSNGTIATEIEERESRIQQCCHKCKTNMFLIVVLGLLIAVLIVLVITLFVMVFGIKAKLDDRLQAERTINLNEGPSRSFGRSMKNVNNEKTTGTPKQSKTNVLTTKIPETSIIMKPLLKQLEVLPEYSVVRLKKYIFLNFVCVCVCMICS